MPDQNQTRTPADARAAASAPATLAGATWLVQPATQAVFAALSQDGHAARAVGGCVRDTLLGATVGDIDIATTAPPETVMALARRAGLKVVETGLAHGTVTVVSGGVPIEVTTLRRDVETDGRHATVAFTTDWEADASRRDFTINALYCDADGGLFDPLGGMADLHAGHVRFIGDATARIREDTLRILRYFRFYARFARTTPDAADIAACITERRGLARLSAERVRQEVIRLLVAPGALDALAMMQGLGLLTEVLPVAPRLGPLQRLVAIEAAVGRPADAALRLALLTVATGADAPRLAQHLRLSGTEASVLREVGQLVDQGKVAGATASDAPDADDLSNRARLYRLGRAAYERRCLTAWALGVAELDSQSEKRRLSLAEHWQPPQFPLNGRDALALGAVPGPAVGIALAELEADWIAADFATDRDVLLAKLAAALGTAKA